MKCEYRSGGLSPSVAPSSLTLLPAGVPRPTYPTSCPRSSGRMGQGGRGKGKAGRGRDESHRGKGCRHERAAQRCQWGWSVRLQWYRRWLSQGSTRHGTGEQEGHCSGRLDVLPGGSCLLDASELCRCLTCSAHSNPARLKCTCQTSLLSRGRRTEQVLFFLSGSWLLENKN